MKFYKLITILLLTFFSNQLFGQQLKVVHFEKRGRDLTAKLKPRTDNNGDICALLRVQIAAPNCQFDDSYIVGDVELGFGEYLVYMAKGARRLRVAHPDFLFTTLDYEFPEALQSMTTYTLVLEVPVYTHYAEIVEQQAKNNSAQPTGQPVVKSNIQPSKPAEKVYKVGDYYNENGKEGVVFWVDETGKHGKIISMRESSTKLKWTLDKNEKKRLIGADSKTDGAKNMGKVKQIKNWNFLYPAFRWCDDWGAGWYLPAIEELATFMLNKDVHDTLNSTLGAHGGTQLANKGKFHWYWSSTERGNNRADIVYMRAADRISVGKSNVYYVRAVAAF